MRITIPGRPVPKGRPRLGKNVYTPEKTRNYEQLVGFIARSKIKTPLEGDVYMKVILYFDKDNYGDLDNYVKAISDALNGVAYRDDKQIKELSAVREHGEPRAIVIIENVR